MKRLILDIETYSSVDLPKANVYAYVESPDFEVMMCGWTDGVRPVEVVEGEREIAKIPGLWDNAVTKVAHNAPFERVCFSRMAGLPVGTYLPPEPWLDTAALAALNGLPRRLDAVARRLHAAPKDSAGTRLINLFCKPYCGRRVMPAERPEQWAEFLAYCLTQGHKVLRDDLRWIDISEVKKGDTILGFDEEAPAGLGRHYRRARVEKVQRVKQPVFTVTLASGKTFTVTGDHKWLVRKRYNRGWVWKQTTDLDPADHTTRLLDVWETSTSYEDGWLAGMLNGEGHLSNTRAKKGNDVFRLGVTQKVGPVADRLEYMLYRRTGTGVGDRLVGDCRHMEVRGKRPDVLRLLGEVRPERLIAKVDFDKIGRIEAHNGLDAVVSVQPAGVQEIFAVSTSTRTLVVDGYPMHNCAQDVDTLVEVLQRLRSWPKEFERQVWCADQRVNDRGLAVDLDLAEAAVKAAYANNERLMQDMVDLTGLDNPNSALQLKTWLAEQEYPLENLQKATVDHHLSLATLPDEVRPVLKIRQELALVAHRKFEAVLRGVSVDGRLRGQFVYHGAHTARWSSRGVQVHNLPRLSFEYKDSEGEKHYSDSQEAAALLDLKAGLGATPEDLKKLVRPMFLLRGISSDFSAIEARVLAWIAGEQWVLQAFEEGRDLYVETAERMGGGMGRPEGKIAVLAAGYQGSVGSFRNMGYGGRRCPFDSIVPRPNKNVYTGEHDKPHTSGTTGAAIEAFRETAARVLLEDHEDILQSLAVKDYFERAERNGVSDEDKIVAVKGHIAEKECDPNHKCDVEIKAIVTAWREANPKIQEFWYDLQDKFWTGGRVGAGLIAVERKGGERRIHLPSGRVMRYWDVRKQTVKKEDPETGEVKVGKQIAYAHIQGYTEKTYGGRLTENVTQAVARDLLADALVRLDAAGYPVVGHVHDEALVESDDAEGIRDIMRTGPAWATGLPLDASASLLHRYRKD